MSNKRIKLALAIHNHQPVGNFDFVFEDAFEHSYLPFFEILEKYPAIRLAQHFTGPLFEWIQANRPDFLGRLKNLVESGQIEMISGGFYEPVLTVIPERDRLGQIRKMNTFLAEELGYEARGMWLAERIWEPLLPSVMSRCNIDYVVLDDSHFKGAGLNDDDLYGYYITEDLGNRVALFPIIEKMRYNIPFAPPEDTIEFLRSRATEDGQRLVVYADDGEKFGIWPNSYDHCYRDGWVEVFFRALEANSDWIELVHLSEAVDKLPPLGRIYLPTGSYREMMEWSMPAAAIHEYEQFERILKQSTLYERFKVFVKGGFWRNFMAKYPEANQMHKRMLSVSCRLESLNDKWHSHESYQRAQDLLWAGQCNCPYWHGVFGGLYLNHLRFANYSRLIEADALLDSLERPHSGEGQFWTWSDVTDFDSDGCDEVLLSTPDYWLCFSPARGGSLLELDFKKIPINLLDTMTRREEAYHQRLRESAKEQVPLGDAIASIHNISVSKEAGLEKKLYVDWYRRASYIDHFFDSHVSLEDFSRCAYEERGDFVKGKYSYALSKSGEPFSLSLSRNGRVIFDGVEFPVLLTKQFQFDRKDGGLISDYQIQNISSAQFDIRFAAESSFALLAGDAPDRFYQFFGKELDDQRLCSIGVVDNTQGVTLVDEWLKVRIEWNWADPTEVWRFPIETISRSECGFERVYQNSVALPVWHLSLSAGESWHQRLKLTVNTI